MACELCGGHLACMPRCCISPPHNAACRGPLQHLVASAKPCGWPDYGQPVKLRCRLPCPLSRPGHMEQRSCGHHGEWEQPWRRAVRRVFTVFDLLPALAALPRVLKGAHVVEHHEVRDGRV
eukprot:CAMPEP_0179054848 /NCGR_PEP_ID=MMETSP0796-20121207/22998_1 /TAXON_ID=73915 /ORGANISM="Pyrodinium bahamense, Strain pbaha01" /LENGTH=120 /DNA_ID=CAMNT_0020751485 /DNA_START=678 /DNA_END=1040 /DNA_ORIENTATION=+